MRAKNTTLPRLVSHVRPIFIQLDRIDTHVHRSEPHVQQISIPILHCDKYVQRIESHVQRNYHRIGLNYPHVQKNHP